MRVLTSILPEIQNTADFELIELSDKFCILRDTSQEEERSITPNIDDVIMQCVELGYKPKQHTLMYINSHNTINVVIIDQQICKKALFNFDTSDPVCAKQLCMFFCFEHCKP